MTKTSRLSMQGGQNMWNNHRELTLTGRPIHGPLFPVESTWNGT